VKNDVSEAWSVLNKINPKRFPDGSQDAFLRRYGRSTASSKMALQRELGSAIYTHAVQTGVEHDRTDHELKMTGDQMKQYKDRVDAYRQARSAWAHGKVDVEACKRLMPHSYKPGMTADEEKHLAERHSRALGTIRDAALNQVVNLHPEGAKVAWTEKYLTEHKGEPTVIFAHNLKAVDMIAERLTKSGHRVAKIKGDMDSGTKDDAKNAFSPAAGEATADVLVSSDAGAVGANLQRGAHQINYDIPVTAMLHEQRIARTVRMGQKNRVQVHNLAADCPVERNARRVLRTKGELRELVTASEESIDDSGLGMRLKRANAMTLNNLYGGSGK
jgi:SNF2 family DNA or RNA helicase